MSDDDNVTEFPDKKKTNGRTIKDGIPINYPQLITRALLSVVRGALRVMERNPVPGLFNFSFTINMLHPDVMVPDWLRAKYPEFITIILNQQYEELVVTDTEFSVTLYFNGLSTRLVVPFDSIMEFADPTADFVLAINMVMQDNDPNEEPVEETFPDDTPVPQVGGDNIVSLDAFRKKP